MMSDQNKINDAVWAACETFRGDMSLRQARDYVLVLLFLKFLSDSYHEKARQFRSELGASQVERIERKLGRERFILPQVEVHEQTGQVVVDRFLADIYGLNVRREQPNFSSLIDLTLSALETHNKAKLGRVFHHISFNNEALLGPTSQRNTRLKHLVSSFAYLELRDTPNGHGRLFQYLLERYAIADGKNGAPYTPEPLARLLVALLRPEPGHHVCDPVCATGGLLVEAAQQQKSEDCGWFGQEADRAQWALARMNLFIHGRDAVRVEVGDTLREPLLATGKQLLQFDIVLAQPPLPQDQWQSGRVEQDPFGRYWRGTPPKSKADYAYISHLVEITRPLSGRMAVIAPQGVLFRSGAEGRIRQRLISENLLDAVIVLPGNLLPHTTTPLAILLFDRAREAGGARAGVRDVFLLDAGSGKAGKRRGTLPDGMLQQILAEVASRTPQPGRCHVASLDEIAANGYDLNLPRYLRPARVSAALDLRLAMQEIAQMERELARLRALQMQQLSGMAESLPC
jgi:type I restriction enzyme M protein